MRVFFLLFPLLAWSDLKERAFEKRDVVKKEAAIDRHLEKILAQEKTIAKLLSRPRPKKRIPTDKITALSRFRGILLNSVLATDVKASKFIVRIAKGKRKGAELRCLGVVFRRRILGKCDLLVIRGRDYEVDVEIWDLDGAEGIIADHHYTGEEKEFLASSLASFWRGITETAKDQIPRHNKFLKGIAEIGESAGRKIEESGSGRIAVSLANSGKEVIVFFNQTVRLKGVKK
ncbi:MAG: hypothetical protein OXB88_06980 [Bacteriovoracales bacterium]|nr:hypothetical protein [Bacteriovoracales bacterium]